MDAKAEVEDTEAAEAEVEVVVAEVDEAVAWEPPQVLQVLHRR